MFLIQTVQSNRPPDYANPFGEEADMVLVQRAQKDLRLFQVLYDRYATRVYRYLLVRVGNVHDAQDLTSQTFLSAMENLPKYRGQSPFVAWLFGIARHKAADQYRRTKVSVDLAAAESLPDEAGEPDDVVERRWQLELVSRKLQTLTPERAEALSLRLFAGLEVAEIAQMLGKNEAAVRMLVHRGMRDLQAQLKPGADPVNQEENRYD